MTHMQWKERFNIEYKDIDAQHRGLIDILNDLIDLLERRRDPDQVAGIFHRLFEYSQIHFSTEERYMRKARFVGLLAHKAEHASFIRKLLEFNERYDPSNPKLLEETIAFLREWYVNHIMRMDMAYVPHMKALHAKLDLKAVVFDFGNVICRFDNHLFTARLAELCDRNPAEVHRLVYAESTLTRDYETGAIDSQGFLRGLSTLCEHPFAEHELLDAYCGIFTPVEGTLELLRRLKPRYRLALLSNTSAWHFEKAIRTSPAFPLFDAVTVSFQAGVMKPSRLLLDDVLGKLDMISEECACVDDLEPCVALANEQLFHGVLFTGADRLETDLRKLGLQF